MLYQIDELVYGLDSDLGPLVEKAWNNIMTDIEIHDNLETMLISEFSREQARG
jgi:hypothetical protein